MLNRRQSLWTRCVVACPKTSTLDWASHPKFWIAPADLPYVHVFVTPSASQRSMIRGPLPDPLISSGSSTRTVHDLSAWAALSIEFAGLLARGDVRRPGAILLNNSWLQLQSLMHSE